MQLNFSTSHHRKTCRIGFRGGHLNLKSVPEETFKTATLPGRAMSSDVIIISMDPNIPTDSIKKKFGNVVKNTKGKKATIWLETLDQVFPSRGSNLSDYSDLMKDPLPEETQDSLRKDWELREESNRIRIQKDWISDILGRGTESLSFKELPCSFATYVHTLKREVYQKQAEVSLAAGNIESALSYLKSSSLHSLAADSERQKELDVELSREIEKCPEDVQILIVKPDYAKRLKERLSGREFQMEDQKDQEMLFQPKPGGNEREVNPLERIYFGRELLFIALRVFLDESSSKQPTPFQIKEEIAALEPVIIEDWIDFMKQIPSLPKHYGYSQQTKDFFQLEQNKDLPCRGILQLTTR